MIDIQAPHQTTHTWKDFLIHMSAICLGILIAIGLEQSVEFLHRRHQLHELREGANVDAQLYLHDVDQNRAADNRKIEDLTVRVQQVRDAIFQQRPLPPPAYRPALPINTIRLGNLSAARSSGLINLLTTDEINSAGDAEVAVIKSESLKQRAQESATKRIVFEQRFQSNYPSGPFDFSRITPAQLDEYLGLLLEERLRRADTLAYLDEMHRSCEAYLNGQRNLGKLREAQDNLSQR